jgi:hypothetical protein
MNKSYSSVERSFIITAYGHPSLLATHRTTWQLTKEDHLSTSGDCIIGVRSSVGLEELPQWLADHLKNGEEIEIELSCDNFCFKGRASGHVELRLSDPVDMVFRRSSFISDRTIAINSSFVAMDLPREMIKYLQSHEAELEIKISAYSK